MCAYLKSLGWPDPIAADSGNGAHLLYRIDLPPDDGLVQRCLQALAARFDDDTVKIDTMVHNAARIWKVYGTVSRKGDNTVDRPHRMARILSRPTDLCALPVELLDALAAEVEATAAKVNRHATNGSTGTGFDLEEFIALHGLDVDGPHPWNGEQGPGRSWGLQTSPLCDHHGDGAFIIQHASGAITARCHHNSCDWGWAELRGHLEPKRAQAPSADGSRLSSACSSAPTSADTWPEPLPLPVELPPVAPFDEQLLPAPFRPHVRDIAERMQCPIDFPAVAMMVVEATIVGRRIGICPKRHDDWLVIPNLWGAVVGRPGLMKTPALAEPLKLLKRLEVDAKREFEVAMQGYTGQALVQKVRRSVAEQKIRKALKSGHAPDEILAELQECEQAPPIRCRYLCNDTSVEKLGEILSENPNGVLVFRDELIGLLRRLDSEGQEGSRAFYLEAWNGNSRFTYDRIGRGTIDIETAIVSVLGGIQPGPLAEYLRSATQQSGGDDGLVQRFQMTVWPDVTGPWRNVDCWPDTEAKNTAWDSLLRLHSSDFGMFPQLEDHGPFLRYSESAQGLFNEWRTSLEARLRSGDLQTAMESHLAKYRSLVPTLALLVELAERAGAASVSEESLRRAIGWADYLESHANRLYAPAIQRDLVAAQALAAKIKGGRLNDGFTLRDVYRPGWTHLSERQDALQAVGVLIDSCWLRVEQRPTDGRTASLYHINPKIAPSPQSATDKADRTATEPAFGGSVSTPVSPLQDIADTEWGEV